MNQLDLLYRALVELKKTTTNNNETKLTLDVIRTNNANQEKIILTKYNCKIDLDWIEEIEKGLEFLDKAIKEDRQFITSEGEVIEIEKVKSVSKETVEHLARHSELITRETPGQDLTPDKLYSVKKLTDYTIYENRFLYMVLCYLRDFISIRNDKINEKVTTYKAETTINKVVSHKNQKLSFDLKVNDVKTEDPLMIERNPAKEILARIDILLKNVLLLLKTPLMEEVAKAPMLRPPITKTNVLKMNKNFKAVLALYEFVSAYTKDGYEIEEYQEVTSPFNKDCGEDFSELILLSSFLTYEHSNKIKPQLQEEYDREELRIRALERKKFEEQIQKAKRMVEESKMRFEEYIVLLEQKNRLLEKDSILLEQSREQINDLNHEIKVLNEELKIVDHLKDQIEELNFKHNEEIISLNKEHLDSITKITEEHNDKLNAIYEEQQNKINELNKEWQLKYDNTIQEKQEELRRVEESHLEYCSRLRSEADAAILKAKDIEAQATEAINKYQNIVYEKRVLLAELNGIRRQYNLHEINEENYANEERFKELEEELKAFTKFFNEVWKKSKPVIRKRLFKENPYVPKIKK